MKFQLNPITVVKTPDAVDQDRHGINGMGLGQLDTAKEAICNMTKVNLEFLSINVKNM